MARRVRGTQRFLNDVFGTLGRIRGYGFGTDWQLMTADDVLQLLVVRVKATVARRREVAKTRQFVYRVQRGILYVREALRVALGAANA